MTDEVETLESKLRKEGVRFAVQFLAAMVIAAACGAGSFALLLHLVGKL